MFVLCVQIHVKPQHVQDFIRASRDNASNTIQEPGNLRFDVIQQADDPNRFVLYEAYRDEAALEAHRQTAHYARWRDAVTDWMAEPRKGVKYVPLFPEDENLWAARA